MWWDTWSLLSVPKQFVPNEYWGFISSPIGFTRIKTQSLNLQTNKSVPHCFINRWLHKNDLLAPEMTEYDFSSTPKITFHFSGVSRSPVLQCAVFILMSPLHHFDIMEVSPQGAQVQVPVFPVSAGINSLRTSVWISKCPVHPNTSLFQWRHSPVVLYFFCLFTFFGNIATNISAARRLQDPGFVTNTFIKQCNDF